MIPVVKTLVNVWSNQSREILLGVTFVIQLVLMSLVRFRWRGLPKGANEPRRRSRMFRWINAMFARRNLVWFCYVITDYLAKYALGNLFGRSSSPRERELTAFWAPFFLLFLAGPDSISALQLEDNQLSARSVLELIVQVVGTVYVVVNISGSWALITAAWIMLLVGVAKHLEKTMALSRANLSNLKESLKHQHRLGLPKFTQLEDRRIHLVMTAHSLFHVCKHAMVDSSIEEVLQEEDIRRTRDWLAALATDDLLLVMEMELSLMYDFLYTKASVIYSWHGYCIRALSPLLAAGAILLVESSIAATGRYKKSDVLITRVLVATTVLMETVSLLRALASSWTGFLLLARQRTAGSICRYFICYRLLWSWCRRLVAFLGLLGKIDHAQDPFPKTFVPDHRRWSGYIGQLDLLSRITESGEDFWADSKERFRDKEVIYRYVRHKVQQFRDQLKEDGKEGDMVRVAAVLWTSTGRKDVLKRHERMDDQVLRKYIGTDELQVDILNWHIATEIYLKNRGVNEENSEAAAIRTLSNYMMYLLAVRPDMLPGLVTRQMLEITREQLECLWRMLRRMYPRMKLAAILHKCPDTGNNYKQLNDGIKLGKHLITLNRPRLVLEVWVDMLFYASYRSSKQNHAKELAEGGDLVTVVWLLAEHASLFVARKNTGTSSHGGGTSGHGGGGGTPGGGGGTSGGGGGGGTSGHGGGSGTSGHGGGGGTSSGGGGDGASGSGDGGGASDHGGGGGNRSHGGGVGADGGDGGTSDHDGRPTGHHDDVDKPNIDADDKSPSKDSDEDDNIKHNFRDDYDDESDDEDILKSPKRKGNQTVKFKSEGYEGAEIPGPDDHNKKSKSLHTIDEEEEDEPLENERQSINLDSEKANEHIRGSR